MKKEDMQIGKRYWYRFCSDFQARSGTCIGVTDENALFDRSEIGPEAWVVPLPQVHCENTLQAANKNSWTRKWF